MCGIVGFVGRRDCVDTLIDQLSKLEYRGYDSAGIAVLEDSRLAVTRSAGKIRDLKALLDGQKLSGELGIAHTRWATHGPPSTRNAHPHTDCLGDIAVVHNGIVENYLELREELQSKGHILKSETDTEVIPHLIEEYFDGDLVSAVRRAVSRLSGSYALGIISRHAPGLLIGVRQDSPLVIGLTDCEKYLASDIPALLGYTRDVIALEDGDFVQMSLDGLDISSADGRPVSRSTFRVTWDAAAAEKGGYEHFMLKEIHEDPDAALDTLRGRLTPEDSVSLEEIKLSEEQIRHFDRIFMVACGTAYYAGCVGRYFFEAILGMPVDVELASEFRYRAPILNSRSLVITISQSGETADTLAALRLAKSSGAATIGVVNVVGSTMCREAENLLYTRAGPEICVASTKAYVSQLVALYLLGLYIARSRGVITAEQEADYVRGLRELPDLLTKTLETEKEVQAIAEELAGREHFFYLGRGIDFALCFEGALKLKEVSYTHAEAYAAGEMKHGPLALITQGMPVINIVTQDRVREKMLSNIREVQARRGCVFAIAKEGDPETHRVADYTVHIPRAQEIFMPVLAVVPLQLFAYYVAKRLGCEIDQPRNLAKSVTVE
ncbi:MAG TPA: glutamine--fructose-6-phosphate transaminase (isomerizing) [Armatimonadota bacterium]|nr:glutamine--fructose-6-phosphate transaminase (isomerizing) [Armatimonadota bacterium]